MNKKIYLFHLKQLLRNKFLWFILMLNLIFPIVISSIFSVVFNFVSYSYIYFLLEIILIFILLFSLNSILFRNNKTNQVDIMLESKSIRLYKLYSIRISIILLILISILTYQSLLSLFILLGTTKNVTLSFSIFLGILFGCLIASLPVNFLIMFIFVKLNNVTSLITNMLLVFMLILTSLLSHFVMYNPNKNSKLEYNANNNYSFCNLTLYSDNTNDKNAYLMIKDNNQQSLINYSQLPNITYVEPTNFLMFGDWFTQPQAVIFNSMNNYSNSYNYISDINNKTYNLSLLKFQIDNIVSSIEIEPSNNDLFFFDPSVTNPLDMDGLELSEYLSNKFSKFSDDVNSINLKDVNSLIDLKKLLSNNNFSQMTIQEKTTIRNILGINKTNRELFYIYDNYDFFINYLINFKDIFISKNSKELFDFYNWVLTDPYLYKNIFLYKNDLITESELNELININPLKYSDTYKPNEKDIKFVKNSFVKIDDINQTVGILNNSNYYSIISLDEFNNLFNSENITFTSTNDWTKYVDYNSISLGNLKNITAIVNGYFINNNTEKPFEFEYRKNLVDLKENYNFITKVNQTTWIDNSYLFIVLFILLTIILYLSFAYKYKKY